MHGPPQFCFIEGPIGTFPMRGLEGDNATLYMVIIKYQIAYYMGAQLKKFRMLRPFVAACVLRILMKKTFVK